MRVNCGLKQFSLEIVQLFKLSVDRPVTQKMSLPFSVDEIIDNFSIFDEETKLILDNKTHLHTK